VAGQVVKDDDVAGVQARGQLGFDVAREHLGIDRAVDDPGRVEPVVSGRGDEGLGSPVAKGA